jgi:type IV secretion system protein TrbL
MASRAGNSLSESASTGREAAWRATGGSPASGATASSAGNNSSAVIDSAPQWARRLRAEQSLRAHRHATAQAIKDGDRAGGGANPDLKETED